MLPAMLFILAIALPALSPEPQEGSSQSKPAMPAITGSTVQVPEAHLSITFPTKWGTEPQRSEKPARVMYVFSREPVADSSGMAVRPIAAVVVERVSADQDVILYSVQKRSNAPFKVLKVYSSDSGEIGEAGGIGYLAQYSDKSGNAHKIYLLHAIVGTAGIQVVIDGTESVFATLDPEYRSILKSLRILEEGH